MSRALHFFNTDFNPKEDAEKPKANDLGGRDWIKNSISIWSGLSKDDEERKIDHPAIFPWKLASKIIESFTDKTRKNILDPFAGSSSTLVACSKLNKNGIGFDIDKKYISQSKKRLKKHLKSSQSKIELVNDNALNIGKYLPKDSVDLCFTSPPYWNILSKKRSADGKTIKNYNHSKKNIGNTSSYEEYLSEMGNIFAQVYKVLRNNCYCIVNVMDLRQKSQFYPLHIDICSVLTNIGYTLDDIIIWDRRQDYNNLRPLGYPYVFRVNKVHEFLLIFKKCNK